MWLKVVRTATLRSIVCLLYCTGVVLLLYDQPTSSIFEVFVVRRAYVLTNPSAIVPVDPWSHISPVVGPLPSLAGFVGGVPAPLVANVLVRFGKETRCQARLPMNQLVKLLI